MTEQQENLEVEISIRICYSDSKDRLVKTQE